MAVIVPGSFLEGRLPRNLSPPSGPHSLLGKAVNSSAWAVALALGKADYPVVNYSEPLFLFLLATHLAISQLISFALRTGKEREE